MSHHLVRLPWGGEILRFDRVTIRVLVEGEPGPGAWTLVEYSAPPYFAGPPAYVHPLHHETFYVLSGTLEVVVDQESFTAPAGSCVVVPPGLARAFHNCEPVPVSFLIWLGPGGLAHHLAALAAAVSDPFSSPEYTGERPLVD